MASDWCKSREERCLTRKRCWVVVRCVTVKGEGEDVFKKRNDEWLFVVLQEKGVRVHRCFVNVFLSDITGSVHGRANYSKLW